MDLLAGRADTEPGTSLRGVWTRAWLVWFAVLSIFTLAMPSARGQAALEHDIKAAFLYNFAQFVDWPTNAFSDATAPIVIGILAADPLGKSLDQITRNEVVRHRRLIVHRYKRSEDIGTCHILFISQSESAHSDQILDRFRGKPILTVGETDGFIARGGIIRFAPAKDRLRLKINTSAAKSANLIISSKLLRVADQVVEEDSQK